MSGAAAAEDQALLPEDKATLEACLAKAIEEFRPPDVCISIVEDPCMQDADSTVGMFACVDRETAFWDALTGQSLQRQRDENSEDLNQELDALQALFEKWRDAKCSYGENRSDGGSMAGVDSSLCYMTETARNAIDLTYALNVDDAFKLEGEN
jgi:uncharacterized protein YecT (DUF1311 family)